MIMLVNLYGWWRWEIGDQVQYFQLLESSLEIRALECLNPAIIIYKLKGNHKK